MSIYFAKKIETETQALFHKWKVEKKHLEQNLERNHKAYQSRFMKFFSDRWETYDVDMASCSFEELRTHFSWIGGMQEQHRPSVSNHTFYGLASKEFALPKELRDDEEEINDEWIRARMGKTKTWKKSKGGSRAANSMRASNASSMRGYLPDVDKRRSSSQPPTSVSSQSISSIGQQGRYSRPTTGSGSRPHSPPVPVTYDGNLSPRRQSLAENRRSSRQFRRNSRAARRRPSTALSEIIREEVAYSYNEDNPEESETSTYFNPQLKSLVWGAPKVNMERSHYHQQTDLSQLNIDIEEGQYRMEQKAKRMSRSANISERLLTPKSEGYSRPQSRESRPQSRDSRPHSRESRPFSRGSSTHTNHSNRHDVKGWVNDSEGQYRLMKRTERMSMRSESQDSFY